LSSSREPSRRIRVLRVIARMNVGGPAHHVSLLGGRLDPQRYESLLLSGAVGPGERSFDALAERYGARRETVPGLGPELDVRRDARALRSLVRTMRRFRPHIVHTHTAKAGTLGRVAARLALGPRPIVVHTYHGHVLRGYFGPAKTLVFRGIEQGLGRVSDCLVGVSQATVDELVELRVAPPERFRVVPLGLDLDRFLRIDIGDRGSALRAELGVGDDELLAVFVGRLVPIKRVDVLLHALAHARAGHVRLRLAIVGDGESRGALEETAAALGLGDVVAFLGFRQDLDVVAAATDVAVLSSDNEGTPVSLIEAAAAARPAVATAVGGVPDVVMPTGGVVVPPGDFRALGEALMALAQDDDRRRRMGVAAREHVRTRYDAGRLVSDIDWLYRDLLAARTGD
jgi:glycosyltransferase involved in cell wall biosynthesis